MSCAATGTNKNASQYLRQNSNPTHPQRLRMSGMVTAGLVSSHSLSRCTLWSFRADWHRLETGLGDANL